MPIVPFTRRRVAVRTTAELARTLVGGALLLGPGHLGLLALARRGDRSRLRRGERLWARTAARLAGAEVELVGVDRIDPAERYVVAPLHEGFADAVALLHLPLDLAFAARDELFDDWPLLGRHLAAAGHIRIPPGPAGYRALLEGAADAFSRGESVVVFPQGSILGIEVAFRPGAFRLAARARRPLLPVVLTGGHRVWEHPFSPTLRFGTRVRVEVLDPVPAEEAGAAPETLERSMKRRALAADPPPRRFDPSRDGWWDGYAYEIDPAFPELARALVEHRERAP